MEKKAIEQLKEDVQNVGFNFNDLILLDDFKWVLKSILESGGAEEWKADLIEFINSDTSDNASAFFYNMLPFVRFINEPASASAAFTAPDHRIYLNAPHGFGVGEQDFKWEFIYFHECLHQLWDTFDVEKNIEKQFGSCDHDLLNIASDCVINDFLHFSKKMPYPADWLVTPESIKDKYGVEYDRKKDTQFGLYEKLMKVADEIHKNMPQQQPNDPNQHYPKQQQGGKSGQQQGQQQGGQSGQQQGQQQGQGGQQQGQSGQQGQQGGQNQSGNGGQSGQGGQNSSQNGQGGGSNPDGDIPKTNKNMDGAESADAATQAADVAEHAADRAQAAADKAAASGDKDAAKKAQKLADKARKAADAARDAADAAQDAAMDGDDATAKKETKKAIDKAKEAVSAANDADQLAKDAAGENSNGSNQPQKSKGGGGGYQHGYDGLKDLDEPTSSYWKKLGDGEIKKFAGKIAGGFGEFVRKCQMSEKEEKQEGVVVRARRGGAWNKVLQKKVDGFIYQKVQDKRRETEPTYHRIKRGSRPIKLGEPIQPGTKIKEDKLNITVAFYIDRSGSMSGNIETCFSLAYQISDKIRGEYKNEKVVGEIGMKYFAFDTSVVEIKKGETVGDGGMTMSVKELLEKVEKNTADYLVNIIITDLETDIDKTATVNLVKKMPGMFFIISNQPQHEAECRDIERACKGKFVYLLANSDWSLG